MQVIDISGHNVHPNTAVVRHLGNFFKLCNIRYNHLLLTDKSLYSVIILVSVNEVKVANMYKPLSDFYADHT